MSRPPRVFVSATTRDLGSARRAIFDALATLGIEAVEQTHFAPDHRTIADMLGWHIATCDAVVHVAGRVYGSEPEQIGAAPRRSYTQLEVEIADQHGKPVYVFLAADHFPFDTHEPEAEELAQLQREHRDRLRARPQKWEVVATAHELQYRVAVTPFPGLRRFADPRKPQNLPFPSLGGLFKGRESFLLDLWHALGSGDGGAAAVVAARTIHGLGGVGKTRTAVEYAHRFADRYSALLFVNADSPSALATNLAGLCGPKVLDLPEQDDANLNRQAAAAERWLERNAGWLLIIDNVDTKDAATEVENLLSRLRTGHAVVTSRLPNWGAGVAPLELDVLAQASAAEFLLDRTAKKRRCLPTDDADALTLARDLDGLALALEQAGAFVARHRCSLLDYRERWRTQEAKVLEWHDGREMKYPRSVAATWQTSLAAMGADGRELLNVLCWLSPEPVPLTMLAKLPMPAFSVPLTMVAAIDVEAGCADLADYSLVKWNVDNTAVKAHQLVLDITRYHLPEGDRRGWLVRALGMVEEFVVGDPQDVRCWKDVYDPACEHAIAVATYADEANIPEPTSPLMSLMGLYLVSRRVRPDEAESLCRRSLAINEATFGPDHPKVASALSNLAYLLELMNRLSEAESLCRRSLAINEATFGLDHPKVARRLNNLAGLLWRTKRLAEAESICRRSLAIYERSYGPDHLKVARRLNTLALILFDTDRHAEAEFLYRRALPIIETSYGPDHTNVAAVLTNLATMLYRTKRYDEAEPLYARGLNILFRFEQINGHQHRDWNVSVSNYRIFLTSALGMTQEQANGHIGDALGQSASDTRSPTGAGRRSSSYSAAVLCFLPPDKGSGPAEGAS